MWPIVLRNLLATWVICGFWDWLPGFHKTCGEGAKARMSFRSVCRDEMGKCRLQDNKRPECDPCCLHIPAF